MSTIALHFDKTGQKILDDMKAHYGTNSNAEVIRKALGLLKVALEFQDKNGKIVAVEGNTVTPIII